MIKKFLILFFLTVHSLYSSAPAMSSAVIIQNSQFKNLTHQQEASFLEALDKDDATIISTLDDATVDENAYEFTKAAIITHKPSVLNHCLNKISQAKLQTKDEDDQSTLLHVASSVGNADAVQKLIKHGLSVNDTTSLTDQAKTNLEQTLAEKISIRDKIITTGKNPLHVAYSAGSLFDNSFDPLVIEYLTQENPHLANEQDAFGRTALHSAVLRNNPDMIKILLAQTTTETDIKDKNGYTALDYAILNRNIAIAEIFFCHIGDKYSYLQKDTILKLMSKYEYNSRGKLQKKDHFNSQELQDQFFDYFEIGIHESIIRLLIENIEAQNNGISLLHIAIDSNNPKIVKFLLSHRIKPHIQKNGKNSLHQAVGFNIDSEIVKLLLEYGADPNARDEFGDTPLHKAAFFRRQEYAHLTPLNRNIALRDNLKVFNLLLDHGSNPNIRNYKGLTPLDIARSHSSSNNPITELLSNAMSKTRV